MSQPPQAAPPPLTLRLPLIARTHESHDSHRQATWLELFFDLCFVVAVAAVARSLRSDPSWSGAAIYAGLFVPVWWAWMGYTWFGNTFDNDDAPYRISIFVAMLAVVWLASSVAAAAHGDVTGYVLAYVALRGILALMMVRARRAVTSHPDKSTHDGTAGFLNRYLFFNLVGLALWTASLALDEPWRYLLWTAGLACELWAPYAAIRKAWSDPDTDHERFFHFEHIRERYGLFTIIVLGESILAVSIGIEAVGWDTESMLTGSFAFLAAGSIWWTYFDRAGRAALGLNAGIAFAWGYGHFLIFAGIAALGVGTELLIEAAGHAAHLPGPQIFAGGLVTFLAGMIVVNLSNLGFHLTVVGRRIIPSRVALATGIALFAWLGDPGPLAFAIVAGTAMVALNALEITFISRNRERLAAETGGMTSA